MTDELVKLQMQLSYQEDSLQQLNDVVTRQQSEIETLTERVELLSQRVRELLSNQQGAEVDNAPPPHY